MTVTAQNAWWGSWTLPAGDTRYWQIGPFQLWAERLETEIRLAWISDPEPLSDGLRVFQTPPTAPPPDAETARFGFRAAPETLALQPRLANRPMVVKAATPFFVPPAEKVTLYMSSPAWVRIAAGTSETKLIETPLFRPSDTWFGPTTGTGELCYASRTTARTDPRDLHLQPSRAITAVHIRNLGDSALPIERIRLPLPHLSVFAASTGQLWTEEVELVRDEDNDMARVQLRRAPPGDVESPTRLAGPRQKMERGSLTRSFGSLLGLRGGREDV